MISEKEALERIFAAIAPLASEQVSLADALDRISAQDLMARIALPPFDNSAMDGYAVIASDARAAARLKLIGEQAAGMLRDLRLSSGEATRIFTGAPIPAGADAVVMQEETKREGDHVIIAAEQVRAGDFIRKAGSDLAVGQKIVASGQRLRPAALGLLASQGGNSIAVRKRPAVAILSTGDEVVPLGQQLRAGEIFESNAVMLSALAKRTGAVVNMNAHARDDLANICAALREGIKTDALAISGGVSVGEHDLVREALRKIGAEIDLWRVKIKPGKPFLFGRCGSCAVFGLPGNPVSAFVTFVVFVRPALLRMMGARKADAELVQATARLAHDVKGDEVRPHYLRGRLEHGQFSSIGRQESHALYGLARANALFRVQSGENLPAGSEVNVLLLD